LESYHIHITGQVQGVGFRPFVYKLAISYGLKGWVKNTIDGVHVQINADKDLASAFYLALIENSPELSIITGHSMECMDVKGFNDFEIIHSDSEGVANVLMTTDFGICKDCKKELHDINNGRYHYPFITCTNCGPRYSIIQDLPYDRPFTTMQTFKMCPQCQMEYDDPLNRRYYSQTNSCPVCRIEMTIFENLNDQMIQESGLIDSDQQINYIVECLVKGKIIAVKGIGGYLLIADASNKDTILKLRKRKFRPSKAFALMYPNVENVALDFDLHNEAMEALRNTIAPIVLLKSGQNQENKLPFDLIAPGLDHIGIMLPYTPLYELILFRFGRAIIATSGNLSNEPIIYDNQKAIDSFTQIADVIVVNDREIVIPQDDSVWVFSPEMRKKIILRRSRGMAPGYLDADLDLPGQSILSVGGEMKSSFCLLHNKIPFISQYLGDLEDYSTQTEFDKTLFHFLKIFKSVPDVILCDRHPAYYSTQLAEKLSSEFMVPLHKVQHHIAHFCAIMGEHNLYQQKEKVLGVIWDGTGYSDDQSIWGGEFFSYEGKGIQRIDHLPYFPLILGDKMPKEPRISAFVINREVEGAYDILRTKFTDKEWRFYNKLMDNPGLLKTSSMGRLFDAVASLVLSVDKSSYEGEAAMFLEVAARNYFDLHPRDHFIFYELTLQFGILDLKELMKSVIFDINNQISAEEIAFKFHCTMVQWIQTFSKVNQYTKICFSGGVFQNGLLVDLILIQMALDKDLYFHEKLSPNDENISFGQLMFFLKIANKSIH